MLPRAGWVGTWRHGAVLWSGDIGSTMTVLKSQINIGISAQTSAIPWWTTDVGGYSGGHSQDPTYRETVGRWFQYGFTCPLLRQHGARDHTCPWFYGNETEQIIEDVIRLRAAMKPYFSAQLNLLNETGRPFNRPLMWDFPQDPKTWVLAEKGIGDGGQGPAPPPSTALSNGDHVVLAECNTSDPTQNWKLDEESQSLQLAATTKYCLDCGGTSPPIHMWECQPHFHNAQAWTYNAQTKALEDPKRGGECLTDSGGNQPGISADKSKCGKWVFSTGTLAGSLKEAGGKCLAVTQENSNGGGGNGAGVIDQYMMGDDYMAAPILNLGQRARDVYFPIGADWTHHYSAKVYKGGTTASVPAPLSTFPLFKRSAASSAEL